MIVRLKKVMGQLFYNLLDVMPHNVKDNLARTPLVNLYRKLARNLGNQTAESYQFINAGPLAGMKLCIGTSDERGYISVREYIKGTYEPLVAETIQKQCVSGGTVLDIGAHYGYFSLLMAQSVGKIGRCIAFEANEQNYTKILKTIEINQCANLSVEHIAISDKIGKTTFLHHQNSLMGHLAEVGDQLQGTDLEYVETTTIDDYVNQKGLKDIAFIKLDIEGAELSAINGAEETINQYKPILMIEVHTFPEVVMNAKPLVEKLLQWNYRVMHLGSGIEVDPRSFAGGHTLAEP